MTSPPQPFQTNSQSAEKGAALVISMILILVVTIATIASMGGSKMQERMTSNQNNKTISLMAAEAGASEFLAWIAAEEANGSIDWDDPTWRNSWSTDPDFDLPDTEPESATTGEHHGAYWISDVQWEDAGVGVPRDQVTVTITGLSLIDGQPEAETAIVLTALAPVAPVPGQPGQPARLPEAFYAGLLSGGNIQINGRSSFQGSVHANGNFENSSRSSSLADRTAIDANGNPITIESRITAGGNNNFRGTTPATGRVLSRVPQITVPSASAYIQSARNRPGVIQSCQIPVGDGGGATYYCAGNVTLGNGTYRNVTILAAGNVTNNGGSNLNATGELDIAIIASGNIEFGGQSDAYGLFWTDGNATQNGSSTLAGSIVARGNIQRNGNFSYIQVDRFSSGLSTGITGQPGTPAQPGVPGQPSALSAWREIYPEDPD
jgi:hypothetical protein